MHYSKMICRLCVCQNFIKGIFISVLISGSHGGGVSRCKCFVATLHSSLLESSLKVRVSQHLIKDHFHLKESHGGDCGLKCEYSVTMLHSGIIASI
jgi:hypothetical protein